MLAACDSYLTVGDSCLQLTYGANRYKQKVCDSCLQLEHVRREGRCGRHLRHPRGRPGGKRCCACSLRAVHALHPVRAVFMLFELCVTKAGRMPAGHALGVKRDHAPHGKLPHPGASTWQVSAVPQAGLGRSLPSAGVRHLHPRPRVAQVQGPAEHPGAAVRR